MEQDIIKVETEFAGRTLSLRGQPSRFPAANGSVVVRYGVWPNCWAALKLAKRHHPGFDYFPLSIGEVRGAFHASGKISGSRYINEA